MLVPPCLLDTLPARECRLSEPPSRPLDHCLRLFFALRAKRHRLNELAGDISCAAADAGGACRC